MQVHDGVLACRTFVDWAHTTPAALPYDADAHRWWRLREQAGQTYWEISADGVAWTTLLQLASPVPVSAVDVELGLSCDNGCAPATAYFDNYNLPP